MRCSHPQDVAPLRPDLFDAVATDAEDRVQRIEVKERVPSANWVWGAFRMPVSVMRELHGLWLARGRPGEYIGTLVNAFIAAGGEAVAVRAGSAYVDVGTLNGYREASVRLPPEACLRAAALNP